MKNHILLNKICSSIIVCVFTFSNVLTDAKDANCIDALAPWSKANAIETKNLIRALSVCRQIENGGNLDNTSRLADVLARLGPANNSSIKIFPHDVIIEIPEDNLAVRYYDPSKVNCITPYSDIVELSTHVINPDKLVRQIIRRPVAITAQEEKRKEGSPEAIDASKVFKKIDGLGKNEASMKKFVNDIKLLSCSLK